MRESRRRGCGLGPAARACAATRRPSPPPHFFAPLPRPSTPQSRREWLDSMHGTEGAATILARAAAEEAAAAAALSVRRVGTMDDLRCLDEDLDPASAEARCAERGGGGWWGARLGERGSRGRPSARERLDKKMTAPPRPSIQPGSNARPCSARQPTHPPRCRCSNRGPTAPSARPSRPTCACTTAPSWLPKKRTVCGPRGRFCAAARRSMQRGRRGRAACGAVRSTHPRHPLPAPGSLRGMVRQLSIDQFENESRRVSMGPDSVSKSQLSPMFEKPPNEPCVSKVLRRRAVVALEAPRVQMSRPSRGTGAAIPRAPQPLLRRPSFASFCTPAPGSRPTTERSSSTRSRSMNSATSRSACSRRNRPCCSCKVRGLKRGCIEGECRRHKRLRRTVRRTP